jgi:ubiquinone/menaquinone biosynthesis C-methylase UbiE
MKENDKLFTGSIPELYDHYMVPMLFEPYARDLAERLATLEPRDVLETAAGTGVLTRQLKPRLGPDARIVATDLNQPMLDYAVATGSIPATVIVRQADALALPFGDASFDAVACQFGVMFFPDRVKGFREARRVLRPGGRFLFNAWDAIGANVFADVVSDTVAGLFPKDPPVFMARMPHGYHDVDVIRRDVTAAGFTTVEIEPVDHVSRAASPRDAATAFCQGTPLRNEIAGRDPARLDEATRVAAEALERRFGAGPIEGAMRAFVVVASG